MKKSTLYLYAQTGQVPAVKIGKLVRFDPAELEAFLRRQRVKPVAR